MFGTELPPDTARSPDNNRDFELTARCVVEHTAVVGYLVESEEEKTHVHSFDNRPQTHHGGPDSHPGECVFSNRGIQNP
ncbi:hypothetical protein HanIR_Chr04g0186441 [Helianthus annuus]|nr:hypothetical protein HanIR_Chr04g0186441 [Helianthus annuus]